MSSIEQRNGYTIRDKRGSDARSSMLYPTPRTAGGLKHFRPRVMTHAADTKQNFDAYDRWETLNFSRGLFAQLPNLGGAVLQKNAWAIGEGFSPNFYGLDQGWGDAVKDWLLEVWYPNCNVLGEVFDFRTSLFLDAIAMDVDGDQGMILTETESGFPQLMFVPTHRIASGSSSSGVFGSGDVKGGPFDGARISEGVILNRLGRPIGARVIQDDGSSIDLPSSAIQILYEPEWCDQGRGIPRVARCVLDQFDNQDIDLFLKRIVKRESAIGLIVKNEDGEALPDTAAIATEEDALPNNPAPNDGDRSVSIDYIEGGEAWYAKAGKGEGLESFKTDRPSPNVEAFIKRVDRRSIFSIGWFLELIDPSEVGGASVRLLVDLVQGEIRRRQRHAVRRGRRALRYAVAKSMKTGRIPANYADWWKWNFDMPGEIIVDSGNEQAADRENLKLGTTTLGIILAKYGLNKTRVRNETQGDVEDLLARAEVISKRYPWLEIREILNLMSQRNPNGAQPMAGAPAPNAAQEDPPQKKEKK